MNTSGSISVARDSLGRFSKVAGAVTLPATAPTVPVPGLFKDGPATLRVHVVPSLVSQNVAHGEDEPVFMIRNTADPRNAIQCRSVRFTGEVRGVFDRDNRLRGSQTAAWMETNAPVYVTDRYGYEFLLDSQAVWKFERNFDYDTNTSYACGQAPSDSEPSVPSPAPKPKPVENKFGC